uniref:Uncharacterized protein n=1 Tax=Chaetoceros debilis TaxID=122233 RepID=A0A7S3QCG2_9STRA
MTYDAILFHGKLFLYQNTRSRKGEAQRRGKGGGKKGKKKTSAPTQSPTVEPSKLPSTFPSLQPTVCQDDRNWRVGGTTVYQNMSCFDVNSSPKKWCKFLDTIIDAHFIDKRITDACCECGGDEHHSVNPSSIPSSPPSLSMNPSNKPSTFPSEKPTKEKSTIPSQVPTTTPSLPPSTNPTTPPTLNPSLPPSTNPTTPPTTSRKREAQKRVKKGKKKTY